MSIMTVFITLEWIRIVSPTLSVGTDDSMVMVLGLVKSGKDWEYNCINSIYVLSQYLFEARLNIFQVSFSKNEFSQYRPKCITSGG